MQPALRRYATFAVAVAAGLAMSDSPASSQSLEIEECAQTAPPEQFDDLSLDEKTEVKRGVTYEETAGEGKLRLKFRGGVFSDSSSTVDRQTRFAAAGDFDGDGWEDLVVVDGTGAMFTMRNLSVDNLGSPADFDDPAFVLTPKFEPGAAVLPAYAAGTNPLHVLAVGDFDGDGWPDIFRADSEEGARPSAARLWRNDGSGAGSFQPAYDAMASGTTSQDLGQTQWHGTNVAVVDYNDDRKLDLLVGSAEGDGGTIRIFLNTCALVSPLPDPAPPAPAPLPCATPPAFALFGDLIADMQLGGNGQGEVPVFAFADFDGDGNRDLVAGGPKCCATASERLRVWKGLPGGGIEATASQSIQFDGAAVTIAMADFSLDGVPDLIVATEKQHFNSGNGGKVFYYENNRQAAPFAGPPDAVLTRVDDDADIGVAIDYDNDPLETPDLIANTGDLAMAVYANRPGSQYVQCGDVMSAPVDLGELSDAEMVISAGRIAPDIVTNGGIVEFFMSNEEPPNWVPAGACVDDPSKICVNFPDPTGRTLRWFAVMCTLDLVTTPEIRQLDLTFDYTAATEHYRAGVIVFDGVAYVGALRQPGDRGKFYAFNAGFTQLYWEAGAKLDAMDDSERVIYTTAPDGTTRIEFATGNASNPDLQATLGTALVSDVNDVVSWVRSARFGPDTQPKTRLGAVETSTPAVVPSPGLPIWYTLADADDREQVDAFISGNKERGTLALFGARDGMVHALRNDPTAISAANNGTEAWAFIPPSVAASMLADRTATMSTGALTITSFPDGSPGFADVKLADGNLHTLAIVSGGGGGKSIAALDITETIDPVSGTVLGPDPLWEVTPGGPDAGLAESKPAMARVEIGGAERFIVIAGTGVDPTDTATPASRGRIVAAFDVTTGAQLWKFQTKCPLTSNIVVFETDDALEPGPPEIDGFMDRAVFADQCGYLYKVNPAVDKGGDWNGNAGLGAIATDSVTDAGGATVSLFALFSTKDTPGSLVDFSPIAGTIGARTDDSQRMVLFFGTGGMPDHPVDKQNHFYAVYADNGAIRSKLCGCCQTEGSTACNDTLASNPATNFCSAPLPAAPRQCEKFYGGVVVTTQQVITTRSIDLVPASGTCDRGSANVQGLSLNAGVGDEFDIDFTQSLPSAAVGSLYGTAGALYVATLSGEVVRIGTPRASEAGEDTANNNIGGLSDGRGNVLGDNQPMVLMGWRQVF